MQDQSLFDRGVAKVKNVVSEVSIEQRDFVKAFIRLCQDGWQQGWHESNGGNLSYRLSAEELSSSRTHFKEIPGEWTPFGVRAQGLQGDYFVVTAAGSHFRTMASDPSASLGIVEINQTGDAWRSVWGFKKGGLPTSEFVSHFMIHAIRKSLTAGTNRVVYHAHPENLIALTAVLPADSRTVSNVIWKSLTEAILVFPQGVGISSWSPPGSAELAAASGELMEEHTAVIWPHHGLLCVGDSLEQAFGSAHTLEKAAAIYLKARSALGGLKHMRIISDDEVRQAAEAFGVSIREEYLD